MGDHDVVDDAGEQAFPEALLVFEIRGVKLAIDASAVRRISEPSPLTPLPRAPAHIPGLLLVGARALPLLDLGDFLALPATGEADSDVARRLLVVAAAGFEVGIEANQVMLMDDLEGLAQRRPQVISGAQQERYVIGELDLQGEPILALDLSAILQGARVRA